MLTTRILVVLLLLGASAAVAQSEKRTSVSLIYEAIAATNASLWLAEDARLFQKYGLDAKDPFLWLRMTSDSIPRAKAGDETTQTTRT